MSKAYKVKILLEIPLELEVIASNEEEAFDLATDQAMEYLEKKTKDSRTLDDFWEYEVKSKLMKID